MGDDTASSISPARDWSDLPPDLLVSVLRLLLETRDLFACAAVSLRWRAACAAARQLGLWPDKGPYLIYSSSDRDAGTATLRNISTGRSFHATLPDNPPFRSRYVVGSSRGWLVAADEQSDLHLLNPVTGAQIALPRAHTMTGRRRTTTRRNQPWFFPANKTRLYLYEKAVLSSDPSTSDCCTVLLKHRPWEHLSFARVGDDSKWTWLDSNEHCDHYHDFFFDDGDGLFYAIRDSGDIHTIDLSGPRPVIKVVFKFRSHSTFYTRYLVRAPWGDLLRVRRLYGTPPQQDNPEGNNMLDDDMGEVAADSVDLDKETVSRVTNLRDHVLFVGFNDTFMLPAADFPRLAPNCVYMTDDNTEFIYHNPEGSWRQLARVNLEDGSFNDLSLPDSLLDWPPPVWFRPSSCSPQIN
ncbi:unnamed protein product [Urochloa decumbens]|uniref:F-box domain-containing protein n=1 Tax=Urochloa decumbens TaxID=240449 RepID=A0ABC8YVZ3_9POAL